MRVLKRKIVGNVPAVIERVMVTATVMAMAMTMVTTERPAPGIAEVQAPHMTAEAVSKEEVEMMECFDGTGQSCHLRYNPNEINAILIRIYAVRFAMSSVIYNSSVPEWHDVSLASCLNDVAPPWPLGYIQMGNY